MSATFSTFATAVQGETAFTVLAVAKRLIAAGKNIGELEVGDSPFPTSPEGFDGGIRALTEGQTHYGASAGLPEFRSTAADTLTSSTTCRCRLTISSLVPAQRFLSSSFVKRLLNLVTVSLCLARISQRIQRIAIVVVEGWLSRNYARPTTFVRALMMFSGFLRTTQNQRPFFLIVHITPRAV